MTNVATKSSLAVSLDARCTILQSGILRLRQPDTFGEPTGPSCRHFLNCVLPLEFVQQVEIHPKQGIAEIKFSNTTSAPIVLARVADVLRRHAATANIADGLHLDRSKRVVVRIFRYPGTVSTWEILHELPGRLRVRHEELWRRPTAARFIESELSATLGIERAKANPATGSVLVLHDRHGLTRAKVLHILERLLDELTHPQQHGYVHSEGSQALNVGSMALSATADFAVAALAPLSAGLLVATNLKTLRDASLELLRLRPGMATLYTAIVGATLASGLFFSAALMTWLMQYWDRRYHRRFTFAQQQLLGFAQRQPPFVWLCQGDTEIEIPVENVRVGDSLAVRAGELVPADGIVIEGTGQIHEDDWRPATTSAAMQVGDRVWAGAILRAGQIRLRVVSIGDRALAASIRAIIERVTTPPHKFLRDRGKSFANVAVTPTLATATIGLLTGDIATANAILRADYASGPGMTVPLGLLEDIANALRFGVVVVNSQLFAKLAEVTTLLIDSDDDVFWLTQAEIDQLRGDKRLSIALITSSSQRNANRLAQRLGIDFACGNSSPGQTAQLVRRLNEQGHCVAFVGDCKLHEMAARLAHVSISLTHQLSQNMGPADALLLNHNLSKLAGLWAIANQTTRRSWRHAACTVTPNLLCIVGAFTLGFTGLHTVLLTNLGTLTVYRSAERWLRERAGHAKCATPSAISASEDHCSASRVAWNGIR
jgi:cation transport ATPase